MLDRGDSSGYLGMDVLACEDEVIDGQPLLPPAYRTLEHVLQSPVKVSHRQHQLAAEVAQIPR